MADELTLNVGFPFQLDGWGRVFSPDEDEHIKDLIEQVLLTSPGERVNRPDFGSGLLQVVFASITPEEQTAVQFTVRGSLQKWLGDLIQVSKVVVSLPPPGTLQTSTQGALKVQVDYVVKRNRKPRSAIFFLEQHA